MAVVAGLTLQEAAKTVLVGLKTQTRLAMLVTITNTARHLHIVCVQCVMIC